MTFHHLRCFIIVNLIITFLARVYSCQCFPYVEAYNTNKLQPRSVECVFLECTAKQNGYICFDFVHNKYNINHHVVFNESFFPFSHISNSGNKVFQQPHIPVINLPACVPLSATFESSTLPMSPMVVPSASFTHELSISCPELFPHCLFLGLLWLFLPLQCLLHLFLMRQFLWMQRLLCQFLPLHCHLLTFFSCIISVF